MTQHIQEAPRSPGVRDTRGQRTSCRIKGQIGGPRGRGSSPHPPDPGSPPPTTGRRSTLLTHGSEFPTVQAAIRNRARLETALSGARDPPPLGTVGSMKKPCDWRPPTRGQQAPPQSGLNGARLHSPRSAAPRKYGTEPWLSYQVRERTPRTNRYKEHLEGRRGTPGQGGWRATPEGGVRGPLRGFAYRRPAPSRRRAEDADSPSAAPRHWPAPPPPPPPPPRIQIPPAPRPLCAGPAHG